ncbi:MAG: hypothetical protein QQN41_12160, partial [Nitrosopumilus sp.]
MIKELATAQILTPADHLIMLDAVQPWVDSSISKTINCPKNISMDNFKEIYSIKYILCLLNSKLYYFWLYHKGKRKGETLELFQKPLSEVPIMRIPHESQNKLILIVNQILSITKSNDYINKQAKQSRLKALEREIDQLVYKLFGLTEEEIKIVESTS